MTPESWDDWEQRERDEAWEFWDDFIPAGPRVDDVWDTGYERSAG